MKPKFPINRIFAGSIALFITVSSLHSASLTWDANGAVADQTNGDGAWLNPDQWWDGAINAAWSSGDDATFAGPATAGGAVTLASPTTVNLLTLSPSFTGTYTLGSAGQMITLNSGIAKNAGSGAATILSPITLGGAQSWTNNSTTVLTTSNGTNLIDNGGHQLTIDGTGTTNLGTISNAAVAITGSGALVKNGSGRLSIGGVNAGFTGAVTINGGILHVYNDAGAMGNGNLTLNGGVLSFYWSATYTRTLDTVSGAVQILGGESGFAGSGTTGPTINLGSTIVWGALGEGTATGYFNPTKFVLGDSQTTNAAATTFSSGIDLNGATRTILVPSGNNAGLNRTTISGAISNSAGTASLIKEGGGILFLTATPTYNGTTTVSAGRLDLGSLNLSTMGGGVGVRDITVAAGATVRRNSLDNAFLNRLVETSDEFIVMTGTTANALDFSGSAGANLPNVFLSNWASNGAKAELNGIITPGGGAYRLGSLAQAGALGIRQGSLLSGDNRLIIGGNRVVIVGEHTFTGDTTIRNGGRLGLAAFTGGTNSLALQNSALDLGAPSATGLLFLEAATVAGPITGSNDTGTSVPGTTSATFGGLKGSRNLQAAFIAGNTGNNTSGTALTDITGFTLNVGTGNTHTYSGTIGGFGTGATGGTGGAMTLTKTGEGVQFLEGVNTYTGATTINGGNLALGTSGSIATSTSLTLGAGGTLDTSGQPSYTIPGLQPVTFGIDPAGPGSSGKIMADGLDISSAAVTISPVATLDDPVYVLATYLSLSGTAFASVTGLPSGYTLDYNYNSENKIALVSTGAPTGFAAWQSANSTTGTLSDDHDNDGVDNGTEYFLGGNANTTGFTALPGVVNTGGVLSVTWTKAATYTGVYGTNFVVETSSTLTNPWTVETAGANVTFPSATEVKYTFPSGTRNFARLKVTGP